MVLAFLISIPVMGLSWVLRTFFPWLVYRRCQTCQGEGYLPLDGVPLMSCPTCGWGHRDCPECHGQGLVKLPGGYFAKCHACRDGTWPRIWAFNLNLVTDLDGYWASESLNHIYARGTHWPEANQT